MYFTLLIAIINGVNNIYIYIVNIYCNVDNNVNIYMNIL